jgi:hypothetical protein
MLSCVRDRACVQNGAPVWKRAQIYRVKLYFVIARTKNSTFAMAILREDFCDGVGNSQKLRECRGFALNN